MKRLRRWVLNVAVSLSLLLCIAMLGLWVRSYWLADSIHFPPTRSLQSNHGEISFSSTRTSSVRVGTGWQYQKHDAFTSTQLVSDSGVRVNVRLAGFSWFWTDGGTLKSPPNTVLKLFPRWSIGIPHWFAALLLAILPAYGLTRRPAHPPGHCRRCGYDMRETPRRCPECGLSAEVVVPAKTCANDRADTAVTGGRQKRW